MCYSDEAATALTMHKWVTSSRLLFDVCGNGDCRLNVASSRLGPSRTTAQPTSPQVPIQYLDSAPAVATTTCREASTSNAPKYSSLQEHGLYGDSPTSYTTPGAADRRAGYDLVGQPADENWQAAVPSQLLKDSMFDQDGMGGQQSEGLGDGSAQPTFTSQHGAAEGPAGSPVARDPWPFVVVPSQREAIQKLAAKRAALEALRSPAPSSQSAFRAAGQRHNVFGARPFVSRLQSYPELQCACDSLLPPALSLKGCSFATSVHHHTVQSTIPTFYVLCSILRVHEPLCRHT